MKNNIKSIIAGTAAGVVNGLLGAGGGMALVPLFTKWMGLEKRKALATSVLIIAPICVVSAIIYMFRGELPLGTAWPYLLGGLFGGFVGSALFGKIPIKWLSRILGVFMLYGGLKMLNIL